MQSDSNWLDWLIPCYLSAHFNFFYNLINQLNFPKLTIRAHTSSCIKSKTWKKRRAQTNSPLTLLFIDINLSFKAKACRKNLWYSKINNFGNRKMYITNQIKINLQKVEICQFKQSTKEFERCWLEWSSYWR